MLIHDELSVKVKNPVQYVRLKMRQRGETKAQLEPKKRKPSSKSEETVS